MTDSNFYPLVHGTDWEILALDDRENEEDDIGTRVEDIEVEDPVVNQQIDFDQQQTQTASQQLSLAMLATAAMKAENTITLTKDASLL